MSTTAGKIASSPSIANVLGGTNLAVVATVGSFLWHVANQQLATVADLQQGVARIEYRVAGIEALREQLAELARDLELLRSASASDVAGLDRRLDELGRRVDALELCVRDKTRCGGLR